MKKILFLPVLLMLSTIGFSQTTVKIDKKEVKADKEIVLSMDDTIYLEAEGLQPESKVHFKIKKAGIKLTQDFWQADKEGNIKGIFDIPNLRVAVMCLLSYIDAAGKLHEVNVRLKIRK